MNAVEKLEAAITKLEELRVTTTPGPWSVHNGKDVFGELGGESGTNAHLMNERVRVEPNDAWQVADFGVSLSLMHGGRFSLSASEERANAELAVTLHRTIDTQLAILRHVLTHMRGDLGISTNRHVVALAEAILGVSDADVG